MSEAYLDFLAAKAPAPTMRGLSDVPALNPQLALHQRHCAEFALRAGGSGCYLDTGLGKTLVEHEFCAHGAEATNGYGLILSPLAVAGQIAREAARFGYNARVIRDQSEARPGTNICNYDRLDKLDPRAFGAVALDEASILKNFTGATTRKLIRAFSETRFRLAATATPAPNDHMELGQQAEFLGIMPSNEMLMRWFISDQTEMGRYRLKHHAVQSFWDWMAGWARMGERPSDLGGDDTGFDLPPLNIHRHRTGAFVKPVTGALFETDQLSATDMHRVKRQTAESRAKIAADLAGSDREPWVIWVDTDYEADAVLAALPEAVEVRGSHPVEWKERRIEAFLDGSARVLLTKPSVCGWGLNLQHCAHTAFVGRSFSYEAWYQAVRRFWRYGQQRPVHAHLIVAEGEDAIGRVIDRKATDHIGMKAAMREAMARAMGRTAGVKVPYDPRHIAQIPRWLRSAA